MADDDENKKDKKEDSQIRNELNAIKAQVTATNNPAELSRLAGLAANLLSSTNNPQLIEQIKSTQAAIYNKEENAEQRISSEKISENAEAQEYLREQKQAQEREAIRERELDERHERLKAQHPKIMQDADELIEKKKKRNENLQSVLDDIKAGREVNRERMQACFPTEEEREKEKEHEKALKNHQQHATADYAKLKAREEELQKKQAGLIKDAEEQRKVNAKLPPRELPQGQQKLAVIETRIQETKISLQKIKPQVEHTKTIKDDTDKKVKEHEAVKKREKDGINNLQEEIKKQKEKNPQHPNIPAFDSFSALLLNQPKIVETSEIKNSEQNSKPLEAANKKEPPIILPGKPSPDIILPGKEDFPPLQKTTEFKKAPNVEEETLELIKNRPVLDEKIKNIAGKVQSALKKSQPLANDKQETQVNKLARANQQNKKNDKGHSR